jgi:hypothetical protein
VTLDSLGEGPANALEAFQQGAAGEGGGSDGECGGSGGGLRWSGRQAEAAAHKRAGKLYGCCILAPFFNWEVKGDLDSVVAQGGSGGNGS